MTRADEGEGRYTVVYKGDPAGNRILNGEPAVGRAVGVMLGDLIERAAQAEAEVARLTAENQRLRIAFHNATRRPLGVTPDSGAEFYDQRMADEAEERRVARTRQTVLRGLSREEAEARAAALGDAQRRERAARTALEAPHADGSGGADDGR